KLLNLIIYFKFNKKPDCHITVIKLLHNAAIETGDPNNGYRYFDGSWFLCIYRCNLDVRSERRSSLSFIFFFILRHNKLTYLQIFRSSNLQIFKSSYLQIFKSSNLQIFKSSNLQIFKSSNLQIFKSSNLQIFKSTNLQIFKSSY